MYIQEFNIYYYSVEYMMSCVLYKNSYLTFYSEICRPCIIFTFIKHLECTLKLNYPLTIAHTCKTSFSLNINICNFQNMHVHVTAFNLLKVSIKMIKSIFYCKHYLKKNKINVKITVSSLDL